MKKIILYIAISNDGYIADQNGGVDWLPHPKNDHDLEIVGYKKLMARIDTILMGSNSFKQIIGFGDWGWQDKQSYVFSSQILESPLPCITITNKSLSQFMDKITKHNQDKDIWLLGGATLAKSFAAEKLIDEIILTIVPQNLGAGIPLGLALDDFDLRNEHPLMDGMIQRVYLRKEITL